MKVSALRVLSSEECRDELTPEAIKETGFTGVKEQDIKNKFTKGFTSDVSCLGNDFNIAAGIILFDKRSERLRD